MVQVNIDVDKIVNKIDIASAIALKQLLVYLVDYAKRNHIYKNRTGNLTSMTVGRLFRNTLKLSNRAHYADFIHNAPFGDEWLERAITDNEEYIVSVIKKEVKHVF